MAFLLSKTGSFHRLRSFSCVQPQLRRVKQAHDPKCVFHFNIFILFSLCYLKQVIPRCVRESIEIINFFFNLRDSCKAENNMRACRRHGSYSTSSCHGEPKGRNPFVVLATRKAQMSFAGTRLHRLSADVSSDPHGSRRNGGLQAIRWRHGCSRSPCHVSRSRWDQGPRW